MKMRDPIAVCAFCSKPGGQTPMEWVCPKCMKAKKESSIYWSGETPLTDCCNARARMTRWECQFCNKLNDYKDIDAKPVKIEKKPFSGANYKGREDSLSKVMQGTEFLKKFKKPAKL
ncbi:MAG: hypothetical protein HYT71_01820 [Candidatus Aenigmarchaeota archaeon]|nr:hypothetical protein [Candidatus Aenigmarchaeota archaeon]